MKPVAALVLAAGRGVRMRSAQPKVLHQIGGETILSLVLQAVRNAGVKKIWAVVNRENHLLRTELKGAGIVLQRERLGTAHAVMQAGRKLKTWNGWVLVLPGDAPCLSTETLRGMIREQQKGNAAALILTAEAENPAGYGRILRINDQVVGIREENDASAAERQISEINSGCYLFDAAKLFERLGGVKKNPVKKEYYLTDVIEAMVEAGDLVRAYKAKSSDEALGINTRWDFAKAVDILNSRELERHARNGVTLLGTKQIFIARKVRIGRDTVVHPFTWIEDDVVIGRKCEIGPFAKIRSGSRIRDGAIVGSFVEVVRTRIGPKTCVKHLTYLGDAIVGKGVNVGAGTITANFDGTRKNKTFIRDHASIGSDTVLVAPVTVGRGAKTGAGTVVCAGRSIPQGETAVGVPARIIGKQRKGRRR